MPSLRNVVWLALFVFAAAPVFAEDAAPDAVAGTLSRREAGRLFAGKVLPLLKAKCFACHGADPEDVRGEFDVRSRAGLLKGGASGEASIVPGKPEQSPLYKSVRWDGREMPPKENDRLTEEQIGWIRQWISAGAPWPKKDVAGGDWDAKDGIRVATSGGLSPDWTNRRYEPEAVWAFFPVEEVRVPQIDGGWVTNPIDAFVLRKLQEKGVEPAPEADRRTLARRVVFDLTGLPPTPEQLEGFLNDESSDAWAEFVDRLLASPHYGERMAQHWLDVVRYADTAGFSNDWERPHAWRYRDYVIRAFNEDEPYDRFVKEQIAGDELAPEDPEARIATGFLRMGPWEHTGMSVKAVTRQQFLDDVTHSVGVTFLGLGMRCCKCHDHKFDPLPTRDYYRLQAVFATTRFDEPQVDFLPEENTRRFAERQARMKERLEDDSWIQTDDRGNDSYRRLNKKRQAYLKRAVQRFDPRAFSVKDGGSQKVAILKGGALESPGEVVQPGVPSAVRFDENANPVREVPEGKQGRRLALAKWIAHPDNPLTARVMVNRVWQMHFGTGLVATPNNFGKMGGRPSHPELLDWLANWFVEHDWSVKQLHRLIVTSETYRRSGSHPNMELVRERDPKNRLLAYFPPRRLTAEEIRDAMLAVTGELSETAGGPGVFPEINWEVALQPRHIMGSIAPAYVPSRTPEERHRRTIYAFRIRTLANPMLEVFNRPGPDTSCERRDATTVTPQVFALLNGQNAHNRALALAERLAKEAESLPARIDRAFRLVYGRPPTEDELESCRTHVQRMTKHHRNHAPEVVELPRFVQRSMIDEQTGEPFEWKERLDGMQDYVPDTRPWEVDAETRGLAELCLVLLNSNEFVYVY